jgi:hypothetical protein
MGTLVITLGSSVFPSLDDFVGPISISPLSWHQDETDICEFNPGKPWRIAWGETAEFLSPFNKDFFSVDIVQRKFTSFKEFFRWWFYYKCLWGFKNCGCLFSFGTILFAMDPSWCDIKRILHRHEDMAEGSRLSFNQVDNKVNGHEQIILALLHRVEILEQERQKKNDLEQTVGTLMQCVDALEHECQQLRAIVMPQQSNSGSNESVGSRASIENQEETPGDEI